MSGVFEVRVYPAEATVPNILRRARDANEIETPRDINSPAVLDVSVARLNQVLSSVDYGQTRKRRAIYNRLYHEALVVEDPGKGISFTNMLLLLAHYKIIDDEKALK